MSKKNDPLKISRDAFCLNATEILHTLANLISQGVVNGEHNAETLESAGSSLHELSMAFYSFSHVERITEGLMNDSQENHGV